MAVRRMMSRRVTDSTRFLKMPLTSQALYFHLVQHADDDGVVEAYPVIRSTGANEDDLKILVGKGFAIVLNEDFVTYLPDWLEHNSVRADRKVGKITIYTSNMDANALNVDARTRDRIIKTSIVLQMPEENLRKKKAAAEQQSFLQMILQQQGR